MRERSPELAAKIRRTIIDIAKRRQRPGTGSGSLAPNETYRMQWPDLTSVLVGVPWAIAGGVATRLYMKERSTEDLDIAILLGDEAEVEALLARAGYVREGPLAIGGSHWRSPDGVAVDLIPLEGPCAATALENAAHNLDRTGAPVLTLPFLVMMKLASGRGRDTGDITSMFAAVSEAERQHVRDEVERWAPDLLDDVESLIAMGRLEANEP